ncbi:FAD-dependent oxidoreductase [Bradyrhizobium australiense]|uniref:FAD-binding oxidoreductase n=1 Tax=Bradyrhizobium australiense TaxID=2721161 RepID=A0A7Y4GZH5_9BRAD|nr:FAD-dependent oxidoreductase [Bradyrhizobium australiense]NOJ44633.1 FAD-binding oxidoreductase [Bradyrhizobium australiense]
MRVGLFEASEIGFGGSGRNVGLVNAGMWIMPDMLTATLGFPFGERLIKLLDRGPQKVFELIEKHGIECEVERARTLHCAVGRKGLQESRCVPNSGRSAALPSWCPMRSDGRRIGGGNYTGALLDKRAGPIQPLAYVRGLARVVNARMGNRPSCRRT